MTTQPTIKPRLGQLRAGNVLSRLAGPTATDGDTIMLGVNAEATPPLALSPANPASLVVNIGAITVTNPNTGMVQSPSPIGGSLATFTGGTVTFPSTSGGNAVPSVGSSVVITIPSGDYLRVILAVDGNGNIVVIPGTPSSTIFLTPFPTITRTDIYQAGWVLLQNVAGTIQNISTVYQFKSSGGSGGGGGLVATYEASSFTAAAANNYLVNTTSGAVTATLPAGSSASTIRFTDDAGTWGTHNLTITPSTGQNIQGLAANVSLVCDLSGAWVQLDWDNTNSYWVFSTGSAAGNAGLAQLSSRVTSAWSAWAKNYTAASANTAQGWSGFGTVAASTDFTAADLPRSNTTKSAWKLTPSGSTSGTFTITIATPAVFTATAHGMQTGYPVTFSTTGALPTGLTAGTVYYVNVLSSSTFNVSTTMANLLAGTYVATSGTQSGTQSFTFGGAYTRFTLDAADYNVKQQLQHAQNIISGATGDWGVDVYSNTASDYSGTYTRLPLSTDTAGSTALPNLEGTFRTTFDAPGSAAQYIELRFNKLAANTHALVGSDLIVGPGVVTQGAAVSGWTSFTMTPSTGAKGTTAVDRAEWRQVGQNIELKWDYEQTAGGTAGTGEYLFTLPNSVAADTTAVSTNTDSAHAGKVGWVYVSNASAGTRSYIGHVYLHSTTQIGFRLLGGSGATYETSGSNFASGGNLDLSLTNLNISMSASFPVAEWAGAGTVNVASNDVAYYYGTGGTWGTSSTVTTAQGPGGVLGGTTTPAGTSFTYTFTPTTPIPVGTKPTLRISSDGVHWSPLGASLTSVTGIIENLRFDGTNYIGASVNLNNNGTLAVTFGKYAYGTTGAWNGTWYWSVDVGLPGQTVGFGIVQPGVASGLVSASGVPGNTTGNAIASGYVGEPLTAQGSATIATGSYQSLVTLTLTAGVWLVSASVVCTSTAVGQSGAGGRLDLLGVTGTAAAGTIMYTATPSNNTPGPGLTLANQVVTLSSSTATKTVALLATSYGASATYQGYIGAVRIA